MSVELTGELSEHVEQALGQAKRLRDKAGRSERGRQLSIVVTDLEKIWAYIMYFDLGDPEG